MCNMKRCDLPRDAGGWGVSEDKLIKVFWSEIDEVETMSMDNRYDVRRITKLVNSLGLELSHNIIPMFKKRGMSEEVLGHFQSLEREWFQIYPVTNLISAKAGIIFINNLCYWLRRIH
ncbi:MAG: hypothetical protein ABIK21_00625 [bacterium]